jgi:hypothetical protein
MIRRIRQCYTGGRRKVLGEWQPPPSEEDAVFGMYRWTGVSWLGWRVKLVRTWERLPGVAETQQRDQGL